MERDSRLKVVGCIGIVGFLVATVIVGIIADGWAISVLWGWFAVPLFELPSLSIAQSMGLSALVAALSPSHYPATNDEGDTWDKIVRAVFYAIFLPLLRVLIGWIIVQFAFPI